MTDTALTQRLLADIHKRLIFDPVTLLYLLQGMARNTRFYRVVPARPTNHIHSR